VRHAIPPGATLGILGGGQLGRMTAMAARSMGYDVHVLDPDPRCSAAPLASRVIAAAYDDADAAAELARGAGAVTLEIEQIARPALEAAARHAPLRPGIEAVYVVQDRVRQKEWLAAHGFPVGPFRRAERVEDVAEAVAALGASIVKAAHGGYDGRGQAHVADAAGAPAAWAAVGARQSVVEQRLALALEFSVLVARGVDGQVAVYPPSLNYHAAGVLTWAATPALVERETARAGAEVAIGIAEGLGVEGLLAVEFFVTADGRVLVNELAPRPHNTYHASERANATSQFEQLVRAACALPLGSPAPVGAGAIANLLGDVWLAGEPPHPAPNVTAALAVSTARLHLYGKHAARPGRKMGHLSAVGARPEEALARVQAAYDAFRPAGMPPIPRG
jgi:5-(carboxyamino)imidazole ribonucleotide synthase